MATLVIPDMRPVKAAQKIPTRILRPGAFLVSTLKVKKIYIMNWKRKRKKDMIKETLGTACGTNLIIGKGEMR